MKQKSTIQEPSYRLQQWVNDDDLQVAFDYSDHGSATFSRSADGRLLVDLSCRKLPRHTCLIGLTAGDILFNCTCEGMTPVPHMPCPHVLAAMIFAEDEGLIDRKGVLLAKPMGLLPESPLLNLPPEIWVITQSDRPRRLNARASRQLLGDVPRPCPEWRPFFQHLRGHVEETRQAPAKRWPAGRQLVYGVDVEATMRGKGLVIETLSRDRKKDGTWKKPAALATSGEMVDQLPDPADREIVALMAGATPVRSYYYSSESTSKRMLSEAHARAILPRLCRTGRTFLRLSPRQDLEPTPLEFDDGPPWQLGIDIRRDEEAKMFVVEGYVQREATRVPLTEPLMLTKRGHVFLRNSVAALDDFDAFSWVVMLRKHGVLRVPFDQAGDFLSEFYAVPGLPKVTAPPSLVPREISLPMRPRLLLKRPPKPKYPGYGYYAEDADRLQGTLWFEYGEQKVDATLSGTGIFDRSAGTLIRRDVAAEANALERMSRIGFREVYDHVQQKTVPQIASRLLPQVIRVLGAEGWQVEAEGKLYRQAGEIQVDVTSGIDWFDLNVQADFGGISASLPELLAALRKGENVVRLGDGTFGMLPEEWLKKYGPLAGAGQTKDGVVRFSRAQVGLLDALLMAQPAVTCDDIFKRTRDELRHFQGIAPADPPESFIGELRPYQREALGWFEFLRRFGFGGCLADDMGLGKTVQVLAMLEARRGSSAEGKPSLVVVPRSLVFNWKQEAARFAPQLKVLDHTTPFRQKNGDQFKGNDLVLTTYGTLRNDAPFMKDTAFDYVVLDEAQAIKNGSSESAKAVRLLQGAHRLCLSGTPVQNHLGDLWSLFDFLNPGLLGESGLFSTTASKNPDPEMRVMLSRGLRPFILRRTKEQVAKDLPEKQEQTLFCELDAEQRKLYDELRDHYRLNLLGQIAEHGMAKSRFMILEALLRLRQAACHPALIDKKRVAAPSAKLDALLPRLAEIVEEGHKALVFSQFTSFLSLVRKQLDKDGVTYEYLDGKTRDRQAKVDRFQSDPNCKLFLISLKAGGVGLNLTAADYVFLLDPWWNPAVEAQAIDRTHRIGQTRQVFAFRLIAKNTVEEKVLALQQTKRDLADAIINADNSLIRSIGKEDLELLLS